MLRKPGNTPKQLKVAAVLAAVGVPRLSRKVRHGLSGTLAALVDERAGYSGVLHTRASVWEPSSPRHYAAEYAQHTTLDACTAASYRRQQSAAPSCKCGLRQLAAAGGNVTLSEVSMLTLLHGSLSELYFGLSVLRECRVCCDPRADKRL